MKSTIAFLLFCLLFAQAYSVSVTDDIDNVDRYLRSGSMKGYHTYDEFWAWFDEMRGDSANAPFITERQEFGRSYENRSLYAFYLCDNSENIAESLQAKNVIMFTGLHHAREPLTITMIMLMTIEILKAMRSSQHNSVKALLRDNVIAFLPIVNADSYIFINKHWLNNTQTHAIMMIRKNRHIDPGCSEITGGVDLNRNYSFQFALDDDGSSPNPCAQDYRGEHAFSEPETNSIKNFVDSHINIRSGVNIHSYGNAWIYPYNYVHDGDNKLLHYQQPLFANFYEEFVKDMQRKGYKSLYGNAYYTLDYATNGEAGDWLTGAKHILNLDVELGNKDRQSDKFYPPQKLISKIVRYNWIVMQEFLNRHVIELSLIRIVKINQKPVLRFEIMNEALSTLMNFEAKIQLIGGGVDGKEVMEYGFKDLTEQKADLIPVVSGEIAGNLKGRGLLVIGVTFSSISQRDSLKGLGLEIIRNEKDYMGYPHQQYIFKTKISN